ncbi:MFS transporter [Muribaculaceae bacterium Isolate-002 (NCI)]|nr:MFS transporter [Muribaculaceae bacterium Isolate-002 (NCI)]
MNKNSEENIQPPAAPPAADKAKLHPWYWIPSLYFISGLPNVTVMTVSVILYKALGISNTEIAFYTAWLYLPWVIKPLWSPFVDILKTKRWWIISMQWCIGIALAGVAFMLPTSFFFSATLAMFWLMAFASATHDIAADGFYMLALTEFQQSYFVGIRSTFYRLSSLFAQGVLVALAGWLEINTGNVPLAWIIVIGLMSVLFCTAAIYHQFVLPRPASDHGKPDRTVSDIISEFTGAFSTFFKKPGIWTALAFMLLYRLPEAQLVKMINPFLLDPANKGGLGLSTFEVGITYGTVGIIGLIAGGISGGFVAAMGGLRKWIRPMAWSMSLTCLTFVLLSRLDAPSIYLVNVCVFVEQFGYGFGFTAYMLYLIYFSEGKYATSHYAICTGFMALGLMLPGMAAGWLQEQLGYQHFFIWTIICCVATIVVAYSVKIDAGFGIKRK